MPTETNPLRVVRVFDGLNMLRPRWKGVAKRPPVSLGIAGHGAMWGVWGQELLLGY